MAREPAPGLPAIGLRPHEDVAPRRGFGDPGRVRGLITIDREDIQVRMGRPGRKGARYGRLP
jgi:hypothetical protein